MLALFEPEETIGRLWHRLVGERASYPRHPDAAVTLEALKPRLSVFFRGLGGDRGVRIAAGAPGASGHRLSLIGRIGLGVERLDRPTLDGEALTLPERIELFPDTRHNAALYEWLAAFFAHAEPPAERPADPLQADIVAISVARDATRRALARFPGLRPLHAELVTALAAIRPVRRLPAAEALVESAIKALLADPSADVPLPDRGRAAPADYHPFLPVPLWGEAVGGAKGMAPESSADEETGSGNTADGDNRRRKATRRANDRTRRDDPLILNRMEKILGIAEMMNLNRKVEDDDADAAKQAADDLDEIAVGQHERKAATRLKLELELAPAAADTGALAGEFTYPEWDWSRSTFHADHCRVIAETAAEEGEDWAPDDAARRRINRVRRQFEALRPKRRVFSGQPDGDDLDLAALVRTRADRLACGTADDRVWLQARNASPDLAVAVLLDASLSTDGWIGNRRVLDVEKEALLALTHGLAACGDRHGLFAFTSRRRDQVWVRTLKGFDETHTTRVARRIQALKPGHYTRIGAAVRHVAARLAERPNRQRLLILLSDGKPNDVDHYEGRYGIEDTRMAIRESRREGVAVFGITVDAEARDHFPTLFGRGAYAIFPHVERLTTALPALYRQLVRR
ncbi:VWA domain-containing protein [Azospirillum sp. RWY-5-1]|uniref:VWA domain-containing protein n=1 Tax=Azospirillum oleiclasticum TaxID=2735135 RepID=A0ABX2TIS3_9PROT|nr:VWA domain-containing protein [Azospirillum oleiclasticum]NYZ17214.1 VWA domain-containing protein [Azospirillum oleiclasticum]NYZ23077.1 VWA domain-containing protein [Azospirillum oleiclasticum]